MNAPSGDGAIAYIGDVHLDRDDPALAPFLAMLEDVAAESRAIVLLGDLFNLWVGSPEFEGPHHRAVVEKLEDIRARGVAVHYVEGNRDYRVAALYEGRCFDTVTDDGLVESAGGRRVFAIHGDRTNPADRQYLAWRRISRSRPFWGLLRCLPRRARVALADRLEKRMRGTNVAFKRALPEAEIRSYASGFFSRGHDVVVLGHFHVERDWTLPEAAGRVIVLPEWKGSRRHLLVGAEGSIAFRTFDG